MRRVVLGLAGAVAVLAGGPVNDAVATGPCPHEWSFTKPARSTYKAVPVPSSAPNSTQLTYDGIALRPKKVPEGKRVPGVVVLHGRGGNKCGLWWAARLLASRGYVALVLTMPPGDTVQEASTEGARAARAGVRFLRSKANPYRKVMQRDNLGLVGHSQGSMGASIVQGEMKAVHAMVGFDNLRTYGYSDPGGIGCVGPADPVKPRVPALGVGSETGCQDDPALTDKRAGFHAWKAKGIPAMEAVLAGMTHPLFGGGAPYNSGHATKLRRAAYYMTNWLDRWLRGRKAAVGRLLSSNPMGVPIDQMLSDAGEPFASAAFLPGRIDCEHLRACL
ncbi:MAG: hypothetical protein QOD24_3878 [Solirubrobacteraceae bacterium]|nr:hypothetical protein [Solirubrobacteraceae bacterium]